jgi:hypothetical protein
MIAGGTLGQKTIVCQRMTPIWHDIRKRQNDLLDLHGSGVMGPKFLIVFVIMTMINTVVWQYAAAGL